MWRVGAEFTQLSEGKLFRAEDAEVASRASGSRCHWRTRPYCHSGKCIRKSKGGQYAAWSWAGWDPVKRASFSLWMELINFSPMSLGTVMSNEPRKWTSFKDFPFTKEKWMPTCFVHVFCCTLTQLYPYASCQSSSLLLHWVSTQVCQLGIF